MVVNKLILSIFFFLFLISSCNRISIYIFLRITYTTVIFSIRTELAQSQAETARDGTPLQPDEQTVAALAQEKTAQFVPATQRIAAPRTAQGAQSALRVRGVPATCAIQ